MSPRYSVTALVTYGCCAVMLSSDTLVAKHYLSNHQAGLYAGVSLTGKIGLLRRVVAVRGRLSPLLPPSRSRHRHREMDPHRRRPACVITGTIVTLFALEPALVVIPLLGDRYRSDRGTTSRGWPRSSASTRSGSWCPSTCSPASAEALSPCLAVALSVQFAGFFCLPFDDHRACWRSCGRVRGAARRRGAAGRPRARRSGRPEETRGRDVRARAPVRSSAGAVTVLCECGNLVRGDPARTWREQIVAEVARRVG